MNRALCISTIVSVLLSAWDGVAAHEPDSAWTYPPACCRGDKNGGDCQEIPDARVRTAPDGYREHLNPGDHHLVTRQQLFRISYGDAIPSGDGHYHICLHPTEDHANCFFAPPYGF